MTTTVRYPRPDARPSSHTGGAAAAARDDGRAAGAGRPVRAGGAGVASAGRILEFILTEKYMSQILLLRWTQ